MTQKQVKNAISFSAWSKNISAMTSKEKFTLQWVLKTSSHWDISSQSDSSVFSSSEFSDDLHISSFQPKVAIRIDSTFNVDNANKHGRNFHKDSPCRWISIICPSHSRPGGDHDYLNKTTNSNAREKRFGALNKTFRNEEIIAIDLR